ncbi:hypothetical protein EIP86_008578 [Pleurotus ostreatoroseus]|nr:hypothetical protein EIP86_008578 [Pleurotus ostreatoroseus]
MTRSQVVVWPENSIADRQWMLDNFPGASGAIVMLAEKIDAELLNAAGPQLKVISTMSVGYDHVDLATIGKRVADLTVMLALMAGRNVKETISLVNNGLVRPQRDNLILSLTLTNTPEKWPTTTWAPFAFCGPQFSASCVAPGRTAGFIGFGRIAQATLARLIPFGYKECIYITRSTSSRDPASDTKLAQELGLNSVRRVTLDELAAQSDVLFVLAPGGPATYHMVNESFLKKMKKTAVLVNTARGTLVDSDALVKALDEGYIYAAGLDVVEGEPQIPLDHPLVKHPRCIILPHIGSATTDTRVGMAKLAVNNLLGGLFDQPMPAELKIVCGAQLGFELGAELGMAKVTTNSYAMKVWKQR